MKREILFKGKSLGGTKWVEGFFVKIGQHNIESIYLTDNKGAIAIDINTLSQFVNRKDKNGKKIFEGDYDNEGNCVIWCDNCSGWEFAAIDIPTKEICISCHRCDGNFFFEDQINDFEIIGNINDNN